MSNRKLVLTILIGIISAKVHATRIFVNTAATGANNGTSWTDAFTDLQAGIAATLPGDSVWVAQGIYKPTTTTTRSISFVLPDGVKFFGGFNGTEISLSQRNIQLYTTNLSGDIGVTGNNSDNTYNVVKTISVSSSTRLDGFRIISGNGSAAGGGFFNSNGSPVVANCTFEFNNATSGAAVAHWNSGVIKLLNCQFNNNTASNYGGAIEMRAGTMEISDCDFTSNTSNYNGGALYLYGGTTNIDRSSFSGNVAANAGGVINGDFTSTLILTNSLMVGNTAANFSAVVMLPSNNHQIVNCTFADNKGAVSGAAACVSVGGNTTVSNSIFWGNSDPVNLPLGVGAVNYCIVQNNYTGSGANHIFTFNPAFISPGNALLAPFPASSYDYHVGLFSPAIDAGNITYLIPIYNYDLDSNARVHGPSVDLGCYENPYCTFGLSITTSGDTNICPNTTIVLTASAGNNFLWSNAATSSSITVGSAGLYSLLADSSGCRGNSSVHVNVLNASVSISGNANLCQGDSAVLTANGSNISSYSWNTSATTQAITIYSPGTYSVSVTTTNGCTVTNSFVVTAAPNPNPVVSHPGGILSTTSFSTYQWLFNNTIIPGATSGQYTPTQNGNYSVIVTNSFGCSDTSTVYVVSDVGIAENKTTVLFSAFPNPCGNSVNVQLNGINDLSETIITVSNVLGEIITSTKGIKTDNFSIDLDNQPAGVYFITLENKSASGTVMIVKK